MNNQITRSQFIKTLVAAGVGSSLLGPSLHAKEIGNKQPNEHKNLSDFSIKGFHIDLRTEVMTIGALKRLAKELAALGINAIVMEYEASFPYKNNITLRNPSSYKRTDIQDYVSYCSSLGIEVIPLQECLGHVQYILRHNRYADLRINDDIFSQVDPLNPRTISLFNDLIKDLSSQHSSHYIHVGGDEVRHLTNEKFSSYVTKNGISRLYTQYMKQICQIVIDLGKTPLLWADMILKHPEAVEDLPVDKIIFVDWNYGWDINMFGNIADLQKKGCTFWGAPALRSSPDNYFLTRWEKHFNNLRDYVPYSRKAGYTGMLMTSWSTSGIYGYKREDSHSEILEMFPIRDVYPLSGFQILIEAYAKAVHSSQPIDPEDFVVDYAQKRYGLSKSGGVKLWDYFKHTQVQLINGVPENGISVQQTADEFRKIKKLVYQLKPARHKEEFEHYRLMADIREFYLSVMELESMTDSYQGGTRALEKLRGHLKQLLGLSKDLDKRFIALNRGYLHEAELERLNRLRNERLENIRKKFQSI